MTVANSVSNRERKWSTAEKICYGAALVTGLSAAIFSPQTRKFVKNFGTVKPGQKLPYQKFVKLHEDTNVLKMGQSEYSVRDLERHASVELDIGESMVYGRKNLQELFEGPYAVPDQYMSSEHLRILRTGEREYKYMDMSTNGTFAENNPLDFYI